MRSCVVLFCLLASFSVGANPPKSEPISLSGLSECSADTQQQRVASWTPKINIKGEMSWAPAMIDTQLMFIDLVIPQNLLEKEQLQCDNEYLNTFEFPFKPGEDGWGGYNVNVRGHTHMVDGVCRVRGFFKTETIEGMHQGWEEVYFGAVDSKSVSKACVDHSIQFDAQDVDYGANPRF